MTAEGDCSPTIVEVVGEPMEESEQKTDGEEVTKIIEVTDVVDIVPNGPTDETAEITEIQAFEADQIEIAEIANEEAEVQKCDDNLLPEGSAAAANDLNEIPDAFKTLGSSIDDSSIELDNRARTPEPTDCDLSLIADDDEEKDFFRGRPTTEGFLQTYSFDRSSLNSSTSMNYPHPRSIHRSHSIHQGKSAFESLMSSTAERVLEKIKTRTIDLEPMELYRKLPSAHTPALTAKARPRKLEPIKTTTNDKPSHDFFVGSPLSPLPQAKMIKN